jgi:hypothetical protein
MLHGRKLVLFLLTALLALPMVAQGVLKVTAKDLPSHPFVVGEVFLGFGLRFGAGWGG